MADRPDGLFVESDGGVMVMALRVTEEEAENLGVPLSEGWLFEPAGVLNVLPILVAKVDLSHMTVPLVMEPKDPPPSMVGVQMRVTSRFLLYKLTYGGICLGACEVGDVLTIVSDTVGKNGNFKVQHPTLGVGFALGSHLEVLDGE
jgi:hypothetical protein